MAHGPLYRVPFRRRREGKTNYRSRLGLLKSGEARVVVRTSNRNVTVQFVNYDEKGDQVVASAEARELPEMGYPAAGSNTPSAYLAGRLAAIRAKEAGVASGVLDLGLAQPHKGGIIFSALKGVVDGGIEVPIEVVGMDVSRVNDLIRMRERLVDDGNVVCQYHMSVLAHGPQHLRQRQRGTNRIAVRARMRSHNKAVALFYLLQYPGELVHDHLFLTFFDPAQQLINTRAILLGTVQ